MKNPFDKRSPWSHFEDAFRHFDRGWAAVDKGFSSAGQEAGPDTRKDHVLTASTWRSRWKLFRVFQRISWRLLFRGRCTIKL